jgi:hypothetical protein
MQNGRHKSSGRIPLLLNIPAMGYRLLAARPEQDLLREGNWGTIIAEFRPSL